MSTNRNNGCASKYGLLNSVRHAECGSVFYRGPCPRADVVSPGICISNSGDVMGCRIPKDTHRAQVCCDPDCIAEVTRSADEHDHCCHNCRLRCRCWRREERNGDANGGDSIVCRCRSNEENCDATTEVVIHENEVADMEPVREAEVKDAEEIHGDERQEEEEEEEQHDNHGGFDYSRGYDYSRGFDYRRGAWVE